jgi:hypothetical protein
MRWDDVEEFLIEEAAADLEATDDVRPCLAAFAGETPLGLAFVRPFERGRYHDALLEVWALMVPLGADRLALSMGARAWSWDDPMPPVIEGVGDLRQRVVVVMKVDGTGPEVTRTSSLHPFDRDGSTLKWGTILREQGEGWVGAAMEMLVRERDQMRAPISQIRKQLRRCAALGHVVALSPAARARLKGDRHVVSRRR